MTDLTTEAPTPVKRSKIDEFEDLLREQPNQIKISDMEVSHYITDSGLYAREMFIPAGTVITGKVKKHEYISIIAEGCATEVTEAGAQRVLAPHTMVCLPGTKRVVWAHTDVVWVTVHATKETELEDIEADLVVSGYLEEKQ